MARLSYALRCGMSVGTSSLLVLVPTYLPSTTGWLPIGATMLAPVLAGIGCFPPHLGASLKATAHAVFGLALGVPLSTAALAACGWQTVSSAFPPLVVCMLLMLLLPLPPLTCK